MKKKLLIAESFRVALEREQSILNRASFEVFTTLSGREALAMHREHSMDLIITALELTDISGDDLCSIIRQDNALKNVSIIITCDNNPACVKRATIAEQMPISRHLSTPTSLPGRSPHCSLSPGGRATAFS